MPIIIRPLRTDEGQLYLEIHNRSVGELASTHYPPEVLRAWVIPITDKTVRGLMMNVDDEVRVIAELDGRSVGVGALVLRSAELRACYVLPEAARQGVGSALVREMERLARDRGLMRLNLAASLNAEPFYLAHGYEVVERGEHTLRTGLRLAAVKMAKSLRMIDSL